MAKAGDSYKVKLKMAHLGWGTYRTTNTRDPREGEAYIQIPIEVARRFNLLNSNGTGGRDVWGENLFRCTSSDGFFSGVLRAQGGSFAEATYAKQFSGDKNLRAVGDWYDAIGAQVGDIIKVTWVSNVDVVIEKL